MTESRRLAPNRIAAVWLVALVLAGVVLATANLWVSLGVICGSLSVVLCTRTRVPSLTPFRWTIIGAAVFVLMRLFYRAVFGGTTIAPDDQFVMWVLPQVQLAAPFTGIHLFGTVTAQSLVSAVTLALPFAAVIVLFGAANTLADPRELLERAPRRLANVTWSVSIGLSVFPTIIRASARIRTARALRNDRGMASLAIPLLEQTIERSERLGLSMAVRGFGSAGSMPEPDSRGTVLCLDAVSAHIAERLVLREVTFDVHPGTVTVITGATGSGKTSLLQVMCGVLAENTGGWVEGCVSIADQPVTVASPIALTLQRPEDSFVAATVRAEISFGAVQMGRDPVDAVDAVSRSLGIRKLLDRPIEALSAGEAALVSIAAALVTRPSVLLLDEPIADLDAAATERVVEVVRQLRDDANTAIVIAEHRAEPFAALADAQYRIQDGRVLDNLVSPNPPAQESELRSVPHQIQPPVELCNELSVERAGVEVLHEVTVAVHPSAVTALVGPNGAGKTTLLEQLALDGGKPRDGVVMVSHNVDDMLFRRTIAEECRANDRIAKLPAGSTESSIRRFLPHISSLEPHPRDCSAGSRVVLALALQLARSSCVVLLDEPTRGLDADARTELVAALNRATAAGNAVLVATHDQAFAQTVASYTISLHEGRVVSAEGASIPNAITADAMGAGT